MIRTIAALVVVAFSLPVGVSSADSCPWLSADVAAEAILAKPTESRFEKEPAAANPDGLTSSSTCLFKVADELVGQLSVTVLEYASETAAKAAYERQLTGQGQLARPAKLDGYPAFFTGVSGLSGASYAVKGAKLVRVSHVFSKRVLEAIERDPDGGVLGTHEIARRVLPKL